MGWENREAPENSGIALKTGVGKRRDGTGVCGRNGVRHPWENAKSGNYAIHIAGQIRSNDDAVVVSHYVFVYRGYLFWYAMCLYLCNSSF